MPKAAGAKSCKGQKLQSGQKLQEPRATWARGDTMSDRA